MTKPCPCPRCLRAQKTLPEKTIAWCSRCERWQYLYQLEFVVHHDAVHKHLTCVECGTGALCRDMRRVDGPVECAHNAHFHPVGACTGKRPWGKAPIKRTK